MTRWKSERAPRAAPRALRMRDLYVLCEHFVPRASRHENSWSNRPTWWPAHEIGHLLVASDDEIGQPYFGLSDALDVPFDGGEARRIYLLTVERAAMSVSGRLLVAAGRPDLAEQEREDTDADTMYWDPRGRVARLLRRRGVTTLPIDRDALAAMLNARIGAWQAGGGGSRRRAAIENIARQDGER